MATVTTYKYSVRDRSGKLVNGELSAETESAVVQRLKSMGYAPVSISEAHAGMNKELHIPGFGNKVKLKELAIFSRQFATMINSGLSLMRALSILAEQTESKELARVIAEARNEVEAGSALSVAMAKHPKVFPPLMVNLCKAGEIGGFLDAVLLQIAENYEAEVKLRSKIKSAMTYPIVVGCIALIAHDRHADVRRAVVREDLRLAGLEAAGADSDPRRHLARDEVHPAAVGHRRDHGRRGVESNQAP